MTKGFWPPVIASSLLYGIFYMTVWPIWNRPFGPNLLFVGLFGGLGIIFGSCYKKSGSFLVPWLMHFLGVLQYKVFFA
jgi:membrane protease YdiL (CAAX protease family)